MSIVEMMPSVRALSRIEKLHLIQLLAQDLARSEEPTDLKSGQSYPLWSPDRAYEAADVLLRELEVEKTLP
jgi:hypothetical protein